MTASNGEPADPDGEMLARSLKWLHQSVRFLNDQHEKMTEGLLTWALRHGLRMAPERAAVTAFGSTSFACFCSPRDASLNQRTLAAQFLFVFFIIDDADSAELAECHRTVQGILGDIQVPAPTGASSFGSLFHDFASGLAAVGPIRRFAESFLLFCAAVERERETFETCTPEERAEMRRHTIATPTYIDLWYAMYNIDVTAEELEASSRLCDLCVQQTVLANDLGSIEKDMKAGALEPNYAISLLREGSVLTIEGAVDRLVELYNRQNVEIEAERRGLLDRYRDDDRIEKIVDICVSQVNGNLDGTKLMVGMRYRDHGLTRLNYVSVG